MNNNIKNNMNNNMNTTDSEYEQKLREICKQINNPMVEILKNYPNLLFYKAIKFSAMLLHGLYTLIFVLTAFLFFGFGKTAILSTVCIILLMEIFFGPKRSNLLFMVCLGSVYAFLNKNIK